MTWKNILKNDNKLKGYLRHLVKKITADFELRKLNILTMVNVMDNEYDELLRDKRSIGEIVMDITKLNMIGPLP